MNFFWSSGVFCKKDISRFFGREAMPFERVILAILRLSKNKYLKPEFVKVKAWSFSKCVRPHQAWSIEKKVFQDEDLYRSNFVGLMNGVVPFQHGGLEFMDLMKFLEKKRDEKKLATELFILKLTIRGIQNEH